MVGLGAGTLMHTVTAAPRVVGRPSWVTGEAVVVPRPVKGVTMAAWVVRVDVGTLRVMRVVG